MAGLVALRRNACNSTRCDTQGACLNAQSHLAHRYVIGLGLPRLWMACLGLLKASSYKMFTVLYFMPATEGALLVVKPCRYPAPSVPCLTYNVRQQMGTTRVLPPALESKEVQRFVRSTLPRGQLEATPVIEVHPEMRLWQCSQFNIRHLGNRSAARQAAAGQLISHMLRTCIGLITSASTAAAHEYNSQRSHKAPSDQSASGCRSSSCCSHRDALILVGPSICSGTRCTRAPDARKSSGFACRFLRLQCTLCARHAIMQACTPRLSRAVGEPAAAAHSR